MSARKLIIRASGIAALCGASLATVQHFGIAGTAVRADVQGVVLTAGPVPAAQAETPVEMTEPAIAPVMDPAPEPATPTVALSPLGLPCGLTATAEAMPGAMVALDIMDPCAPDTRVEITHGALRFSARTDALGLLTLDIPALETPAFFTVELETGAEATTLAGLPDLIAHDRAAITWTGAVGVQLHAYLGNAAFGEPGHVWQGNPGSPADAAIGAGGFLTLLGDPTLADARLVQVFTCPVALRDDLTLMAEVAITEESCGQPVRAESLQAVGGGPVSLQPVTLILPGCEAAGEFLMLQNLFADLRLAAN